MRVMRNEDHEDYEDRDDKSSFLVAPDRCILPHLVFNTFRGWGCGDKNMMMIQDDF